MSGRMKIADEWVEVDDRPLEETLLNAPGLIDCRIAGAERRGFRRGYCRGVIVTASIAALLLAVRLFFTLGG